MISLFRCATGESWQAVMLACKAGNECQPPSMPRHGVGNATTKSNSKCGSDFAYLYFCSFVFLSSFLMLNLFVAVIMDNFDYLTRDSSILGAHHLDEFLRAWSEYDPDGTGKIEYTKMFEMLRLMSPPVGFGTKCPSKLAYKRLIRMNMPIDEKRQVHFTTTLFALIRESLDVKKRSAAEEMDAADNELREVICNIWPTLAKKQVKIHEGGTKTLLDLVVPPKTELHGTTGHPKLTVGKVYAINLFIDNYRSYKQGHSNDGGFNLNRIVSVLKVHAHSSKEGLNESESEGRRSSARTSVNFQSPTTGRISAFDNPNFSTQKVLASERTNNMLENGHINSNKQQSNKTLNVPDGKVLHAIPTAAPINPIRPAIMSTPKSSANSTKNQSGLPTLLVTAIDNQQSPQTTTVPNGRRLPVNGRIATIGPKKREKPTTPLNTDNYQMVQETNGRKTVTSHGRPAVFCSFPNQPVTSEQRQPLLSNGHLLTNQYESTDYRQLENENVFPTTRIQPTVSRVLPVNNSAPPTAYQLRQLPPLPTRQLPNMNSPKVPDPYFHVTNDNNDERVRENLPRSAELFYYQTSSSSASSSNSHDSSVLDRSEHDNNEDRFPIDQQDDDDDFDDEDDEQISPYEYDP